MSLFKNVSLSERIKMELRAEIFNVTNTPQFTNPDANIQDGNFLQVTGTRQASERQMPDARCQMAVRFTFLTAVLFTGKPYWVTCTAFFSAQRLHFVRKRDGRWLVVLRALVSFACIGSAAAAGAKGEALRILRVDPPNWYAALPKPMLLVHGDE